MDPDKTLTELLSLANHCEDIGTCRSNLEEDCLAVVELCERIKDLDWWLAHGGFLPRRWQQFQKG